MGTISNYIADHLEQGSWIRKLFEEGSRLKSLYGSDSVYDFSLGNPIVEPPASFQRALQSVVLEEKEGKHRYIPNQGLPEARAKVADFLNDRFQTDMTSDTVVMSVGAGGALNVVMKSILDPGDEVILFTPYFVEYDNYIANHGGNVVRCPLSETFSLDLEEIGKALTAKTRAVLINTPHNPTGSVLVQEELNALGGALRQAEQTYGTTIYLICDDPYGQLIYDAEAVNPFQAYGRTLLASSFSKDLGLAGERLGYIGVPASLEDAGKLVAALVYCTRTLGFVNAPVLVQRAIAVMDTLRVPQEQYRERRDLMVDVLQEAGYEFVRPLGGFFVFPKTPIADDVAFCLKAAQDYRLLIVPGSGFGRGGHFRLSYSVPVDQIERSRDVFKRLLESYK
ncbi:pyridoxal phosphate-dependent aminotransferase [Paenibacillus beijingensis]|uniref:Aminotransferase n=1 Tax=Paenibacillus beijingensis TaxID=1126833 RepID=A0A0D5NNE3_9BACL|nr:pyridoxal phosphate-dependent aminotransferase [Paenibacillus beijingensis]AJY76537.1 aspartate aminotransferase [Paenibacillus beijingensis]